MQEKAKLKEKMVQAQLLSGAATPKPGCLRLQPSFLWESAIASRVNGGEAPEPWGPKTCNRSVSRRLSRSLFFPIQTPTVPKR